MIAPDLPPECAGFTEPRGVAKLDRVYGDWRGRLWPYIQLGLVSPTDPTEAFLVTTSIGWPYGRRGSTWHRVDLVRGELLESHDLGIDTAGPAALSPDGRLVAIIGDGSLRLRTYDGEFRWKRRGGWRLPHFLLRSDRIVAASVQGWIAEFDVATGEELARHKGFPPLGLSPDERLLAYLPDSDHVALRDRVDGRDLARWTTVPQHAAVTPDGDVVGASYVDVGYCDLFLLRPGERKPVWRVRVPGVRPRLELRDASVLVDDGEYSLLDGSTVDGPRRPPDLRWETAVYFTRDHATSTGHRTSIEAIACTLDGTTIATTANDGTVRLWDSSTTRETHVLDSPGGAPHFSDDGRLLTTVPRFGDDRRHWLLPEGSIRAYPLPLPPKHATVTVSGDGEVVLVEDAQDMWDTELQVIRIADGTVLWRANEGLPIRSTGTKERGAATFVGADVLALIWTQTRPGKPFRPRILRLHAAEGYRAETVIPRGPLTRDARATFSADGSLVAAVAGPEIVVLNTRTGAVRGRIDLITDHPPAFIGTRWLAVVDRSFGVQVIDMRTFDVDATLSLATADDRALCLCGTPDEAGLLVGTHRGVLLRFALAELS